ncbi:hypothetical protein [Sinorhizobium meliloti]|uniref:hypothetical protein n=1 Tax=Rhizobium meliloti TaxID=382 RepID=UPI000FD95B70|nr:hypothetical protein [Sinorhizobium meliloti]RVL05652.1 hypothetical protein CN152_03360 [Sinorhizobium meliloti]RVN49956.1 hypothetical protein CN113_06945 [Sinorhizobium meliloti]
MPQTALINDINAKKAEYIAAITAAETAMESLRVALDTVNATGAALGKLETQAHQYAFGSAPSGPAFNLQSLTLRISERMGRSLDRMPNRHQQGYYGRLSWQTENPRAENWTAEETAYVNNAFAFLLTKLAA